MLKNSLGGLKHILLSVSECSSIPNYNQPLCFVSEGEPKQFVMRMKDYLIQTRGESYHLVKADFHFIFDTINRKLEKVEEI